MPNVSSFTNRPAQSVRERRQPVDDDHRPLVQRRLHRRRSRRGHHHVAGVQHIVGAVPRRWRCGPRVVAARRRATIARLRRARDDELHRLARARESAACGRRERRQDRAHFVGPAAGQQRHRRRVRIEAVRSSADPSRSVVDVESGRSAGGRRTRPGCPRARRSPARTGRSRSTFVAIAFIVRMRPGRQAQSCGLT